MIVEVFGWNRDQWDYAFKWYESLEDVPKLPTGSKITSGIERYIAVQREWEKRGLPLSGPEIVKPSPVKPSRDVTDDIIEMKEKLVKLELQRRIQQTRAIFENLHKNETDAAKKACYVQFINSLDEMFRNLSELVEFQYITASVK
jgi:hypothetical protein